MKTYTCTVCGDTRTEAIAATGHTEEVIPAVAPTCTKEGATQGSKCSVCGEILETPQVIPATGHSYDEGAVTTAPTCTEAGVKTYTCTICGATREEEIAALGHSWDEGAVTTPPTCTETGVKTYTCIACGETWTEAIAATGHTEEIIEATPATCTEEGLTVGKRCSVCGEIIKKQETIKPLGHNWDEGTITTPPTCTEEGVKTYTCSRCEATREETVDATGHNWNEGAVTTAPTCTEAGVMTYTCGVCGATREEEIAATGHNPVIVPATEPTCTEDGWTEGKVCSVCDEVFIEQERIPATGHSWDEGVVTTPATCTEAGVKTFTCGVCGETREETIEATGHNPVILAATEPTCTEDGWTEGKVCSACDEVFIEQERIPATGHSWDEGVVTTPATCTEAGVKTFTCGVCGETREETIEATGHNPVILAATEPTCTEDGWTEGKVCSACDEVFIEQERIPATGHSWDAGIITTEPTCTEAGVKTYTCEACGETREEAVAATGHSWNEGVVTTPPTCTEAGVKTFTCTACGTTREETIDATGHNPVIIPAKEPTCTEDGWTEGKECSVCGEILIAQETIDALGHTEKTLPAVAATCTEDGLTEGLVCSVCGETLIAQERIPATGHSWNEGEVTTPTTCTGEGVITYSCLACGTTREETIDPTGHSWDEGVVTTAPTCTEEGVKTFTCEACGATREETIDATGHNPVIVPAKEPTCTEDGWTEGKECSVCGEIFIARETIPATGHSWDEGEVTTAPTCTEAGVKTYTCEACGETREEAVEALGHSWNEGEVTTAPTCTEAGVKTYTCEACGATREETIDATGHNPVIIPAKEPTCTEAGLTEGKVCSACGEVFIAQETVPATGHSWDKGRVTTKPTCTKDGVMTFVCTVCKETMTEAIEATGHTERVIPEEPATCTETGLTEGVECSVCGETLVAQEIIDATGHSWDEGKVTTEPTCTEAGVETFTCTACGETRTEAVDPTGHKEETIPAVPATCTETGLTEGKRCSVCGEILIAQETIEATGHSWDEGKVTTEPTCTEAGVETFTCTACGETRTEAVDPTGHKEEIIPAVPATCTEEGLTIGKKCSVCGEIIKAQEVTAATGHSWDEGIVTKAPTCTEAGVKTSTCTVCGEIAEVEVAATGHSWDEGIVTKAPTCTETGVKTSTCDVCGLTAEVTIDATGHTEEILPELPATCTETGLTEGKKCSICGEILIAQETIKATGHQWDEGTVTRKPTCTEAGEKTYTCKACGERKTETIEATDHQWDEGTVTTEPTCTKAGEKTYTCEACGETKTDIIEATGHTEEILPAVAATCVENGLTEGKKCSVCGEILIPQEEIKATGHSWDQGRVTIKPTCTKEGVRTYTCTVCKEKMTESIQATGHTEVIIPEEPATCTEDGWTEGKECSVCGETLVAQTIIKATGHTEEILPAVTATCVENGLTEGKKCSVCGEILDPQKEVPALGHDYKEIEGTAVAATCTTAGKEADQKCSRCGEILIGKEIPASGHIWEDDYTIDVTPTETTEGSKSIHCAICDEIKPGSSQSIDKLEPEHKDDEKPNPADQDQNMDDKEDYNSNSANHKGKDGTPVGEGASYAVAEKAILTAATDEGPAGTKYGPLKLRSTKQTKKSITLKWNKVKGATKYVIYGNQCGRTIKMKKLATVTGKTRTFKQVAGKKIKKGKYYKFLVVAFDKNDLVVSASKVVHVASKGGKVGNYKRVSIKKPVLVKAKALKPGKKLKLKAKAVNTSRLIVKKHRAIYYESSDSKIATVSKKGVITARKKGTCYVYAYAQNGVCKAVKIIVR